MNKEGAGVGCLLIDLHGNKTMLVCYLELDCTNNVVDYESLVQGLKNNIESSSQMYRGIQ